MCNDVRSRYRAADCCIAFTTLVGSRPDLISTAWISQCPYCMMLQPSSTWVFAGSFALFVWVVFFKYHVIVSRYAYAFIASIAYSEPQTVHAGQPVGYSDERPTDRGSWSAVRQFLIVSTLVLVHVATYVSVDRCEAKGSSVRGSWVMGQGS